ncbi:MAG: hypothetical protein ABWY64_26525 [Tardiphaga sp.]
MKYLMTGAEAVELWPLIRDHHYSGRMPAPIKHCYAARKQGGLFGDSGEPIAGIIYVIPAGRWAENGVLELARLVRHPEYKEPLSKFISFSCAWLRKSGWNIVVSYADCIQGHHGGIYQAASWNYGGKRDRHIDGFTINGVFKPGRSCNNLYGTSSIDRLKALLPNLEIQPHYDEGKHLYWKPLTVSGRIKAKRLGLETLPYPKPTNCGPSNGRAAFQAVRALCNPKGPLQLQNLTGDQ